MEKIGADHRNGTELMKRVRKILRTRKGQEDLRRAIITHDVARASIDASEQAALDAGDHQAELLGLTEPDDIERIAPGYSHALERYHELF